MRWNNRIALDNGRLYLSYVSHLVTKNVSITSKSFSPLVIEYAFVYALSWNFFFKTYVLAWHFMWVEYFIYTDPNLILSISFTLHLHTVQNDVLNNINAHGPWDSRLFSSLPKWASNLNSLMALSIDKCQVEWCQKIT